MDLFEHVHNSQSEASLAGDMLSPLADMLRPKTLEDMLGQTKILGAQTPWRRMIDSGQIPSLILWGPPGTGKTTLANLIGKKIQATVIQRNAVDTGAKILRDLGEEARQRRLQFRQKTVLFIDEIHRLNKAQQDVLLPYVERGDVVLIGATTENPSYELNSALLSRCRILVFERLSHEDLQKMAQRACATLQLSLEDLIEVEAQNLLWETADGDGRRLLNAVDVILRLKQSDPDRRWPLLPDELRDVLSHMPISYDRAGDQHYDVISAFIKSVRGSSPDAALYYLARMIKGGEDPVFIARRLVVLASEDIGNADPRGLSMAVAGLQAVELVGWPEAAINLAQVTTYLASAPKSNKSYMGLQKALETVDQTGTLPVPLALRSSKNKAMKDLGYGKDYKYSHESRKGYIAQEFLPEKLHDLTLYEPSEHGFEKTIRQYLDWLKS